MLLKDEDNLFHIINIKDLTKKKNLEEIRGRIIGTNGKTLKTINKLTDCYICLHENQVGIIGNCEEIENAVMALTCLIRGSKQGKVYGKLEKEKRRKRLREKMELYEEKI